jgi:hypothetical protein
VVTEAVETAEVVKVVAEAPAGVVEVVVTAGR